MRPRIVLIEDERDIVELVEYNLRKDGFDVTSYGRGREGLEDLRRRPADLALLDVMLPDLSGFEICKQLRAEENLKNLPVIFLTARGEEIDRVLGLEIGADDYVTKPFSPRELAARVKAILRRRDRGVAKGEILEFGGIRVNTATHEVTARERLVELSALEFKLMHFLLSQPRRVFTREELLDEVWGRDRFVTPRTVDVHIRRLREKIEAKPDDPQLIQTVRGSGYRFSPEAGGEKE